MKCKDDHHSLKPELEMWIGVRHSRTAQELQCQHFILFKFRRVTKHVVHTPAHAPWS